MTHAELRQAAIEYLVQAFKDGKAESQVIQAAVSIVLTPEPKA